MDHEIHSIRRSTISSGYSSRTKKKAGPAAENAKRPKTVQVWDRDSICLPDSKSKQKIPYPRGKYRSQLGEDGLIGKVRLMSTMNEVEVQDEIRSVFREPMKSRLDSQKEITGLVQTTLSGP